MKKEGSKASRDKGQRVGGNGRRWAEAEKWDSVSVRSAKCLPPPNMATISAATALGSCLGNHRAVKESGPWADEEAGGRGLGGRRLWPPQLDSGWWVMWLGGVTQGVRTGDWGETSRVALVST
ncbi:hypothetical protein mRhiFer1_008942 [Rhinolophus ferrumequinum]|uniref:Uncharacterized protein n=1 Tax=Rhinolophus ferrumequinum TaxID=59479 RepID=A0A7J7TEV6_RHIFE|nr:hypothetical protein mRhiFer1_008942 [Rhinolophus ferrumequinum]